jgi:hypothetical protein
MCHFQFQNETEIIANPEQSNLCRHLRSLTFRFKPCLPFNGSQHRSPLDIILAVSTHLSHLNVLWNDFCRCSGSYSMVTHVHLILNHGDHRYFDVDRLNMLIPKVHYLATDYQQLMREKCFIDFVLRLLLDNAHFRELILLQVNKNGRIKIKLRVKATIKEAIIAGIDRLQESTMTRIEFSYHNQLNIWLR